MKFLFLNVTYRHLEAVTSEFKRNHIAAQNTEKEHYDARLADYFWLGWLCSFMPGTDAFQARKAYGAQLATRRQQLILTLKNSSKNTHLTAQLLTRLPSKRTVSLIFLLALASLTLTVIGLGGLLAAGTLGVTLANNPVGLALIALFNATSFGLAVSTLLLSLTAGIGGTFALLGLAELITPGTLWLSWPGHRVEISRTFKSSWMALWEKTELSSLLRNLNRNFIDNDNWDTVASYLFNPVRWAKDLLSITYCTLIELGNLDREAQHESSWPGKLFKGFIFLTLFPLYIPLIVLEPLTSLPYWLVRNTLLWAAHTINTVSSGLSQLFNPKHASSVQEPEPEQETWQVAENNLLANSTTFTANASAYQDPLVKEYPVIVAVALDKCQRQEKSEMPPPSSQPD